MGKEDTAAMEERIREGEAAERKEKKKKRRERMKKEKSSFFADFKKFITKGNVLDMAVAVVIATSFNAIVNGLVKNIITPIITYLTSGVSIDEWKWVLKEAVLDAEGVVTEAEIAVSYGLWLQAIVDFFIIALSVFAAVRVIKGVEKKLKAKEIAKAEAEAAAKKAEEDAKAAAAAQAAAAAAAEKKAIEDEFYQNVRDQAALLREIRDALNKQ